MPQAATTRSEILVLPFQQIELRAAKPDSNSVGTLAGYAAVFGELSEDMWGFREHIRKGAFKKSLDSGADVRALAHHDWGQVLGRRSANTLRISEDDKGLKVEIDLPDTSDGRDVMNLVKRGDLDNMSFGFRTLEDNWYEEKTKEGDKLQRRELIEVELFEVSIVALPAYKGTSIKAEGRDVMTIAEIRAAGLKRLAGPTNNKATRGTPRLDKWTKRLAKQAARRVEKEHPRA